MANITVLYTLQPAAGISEQAERFQIFIGDTVWIAGTESTHINIRSADTVFKSNGLELNFRQIYIKDDSGCVGF